MNIKFCPIHEESKDLDRIKRLFVTAFPAYERIPFKLAMGKSKESDLIEFLSIWDDQTWIGLLYTATKDRLTYIFYFAIDESLRSKGYGGEALSEIIKKYSDRCIILNIEETANNAPHHQRLKRKNFYLRNNFKDVRIVMSSYGHNYETLVYCPSIEETDFNSLKETYSEILSTFISDFKLSFSHGGVSIQTTRC
ncbi:MAG: GNAT family N-acetyltransferase [Peptostreptococcales bacterium]|jgi:GNAT superfamily N-acetyltransferase